MKKNNKALKEGINVVGHIKNETGLGEGSRLTINAIKSTNLNWLAFDYDLDSPEKQNDYTFDDYIEDDLKYDISIVNFNADQIIECKKKLPEKLWDTYRIGVFYWECQDFPDKWIDSFKYFDEIWAPTKFIQESLLRKSLVPVVYMPPGLARTTPNKKFNRKYFGLPENTFLFLNFFDMLSYVSRKNPLATLNAFKKAFKPDDMSVGLVLKVNNGRKDLNANEIRKRLKNYKNVYIIDETFSRDEINSLINCCNASISLHRSEGLGLLCQESMYYGKPVIATGWSGNMDFMNSSNSCLVNYKMIRVEDYYCVDKDTQDTWADPDVDDASKYMLKLFKDKKYYAKIAANAKKTIHTTFSSKQCGKRMKKRIEQIHKNKDEWKYRTRPVMSSSEINLERYEVNVNAHKYAEIDFYQDIGNNPIKKLIRKAVTFLVNRIVWEQNVFNKSVLKMVDDLVAQRNNDMLALSKAVNKTIRHETRDIESKL